VQSVKVNEKSYEDIEIYVEGCNNDEQIMRKISDTLGERASSDILMRMILKGYVEQGYSIDTGYISSYFDSKVFFMKLIDETVPDYDFDVIKSEPGLKGLFARKIFALMECCDDKKKERILKKALYMGMEALEKGEVTIRQE